MAVIRTDVPCFTWYCSPILCQKLLHSMHINEIMVFYCPLSAVMYSGVAVQGLLVENVGRGGNCQLLPLNIQ